MEKEKMVEEMVSIMGEWAIENRMCFNSKHAESLAHFLLEKGDSEGAVVLSKEELEEHDKEKAREIRDYLKDILHYDMTEAQSRCYRKVYDWVLEHFKIEEEETNSSDNENGVEVQ